MISDVMKLAGYQSPAPQNTAVMVLNSGKTLYIVREFHTGNATLKNTVDGFLQRRIQNGR